MMRVGSVNWSLCSRWIQRGIELAIGEVAGAAEHDEIERIDLDDLRGHVGPSAIARALSGRMDSAAGGDSVRGRP